MMMTFVLVALCSKGNFKKEDIAPFQLKIGSVDSFSSALFVEVQDIENILSHIRQKLDTVSNEIAALDYCPHITLGLYKKDYSSNLILQKFLNYLYNTHRLNLILK